MPRAAAWTSAWLKGADYAGESLVVQPGSRRRLSLLRIGDLSFVPIALPFVAWAIRGGGEVALADANGLSRRGCLYVSNET
jgi:hypothetical protein